MYFAIIGDIIDSKQLKTRAESQRKLLAILEQINASYKEDIASNFTITLGDEFQALLKSPLHLLEIVDKIKFQFDPIQIRFGVGIGEMITPINKEVSIGADGPAYWNAREAIQSIHQENDYQLSRILIKGELQENWLNVVNDSLRLCDFIESRWRSSQKDLIRHSILIYGYDLHVPQKELAKQLDMSAQATNQRIQSTGYYQYLRLKQTISTTLTEEWGGENNE